MAAMSSGQAGYYLTLAQEDYYLKGGEPPGIWYGLGAERIGLEGQVLDDQLYNLFKGASPDGSRDLVQIQQHDGKAEHRPGWDLTFSAPKSVSVLWSQASPEKQRLLQGAHLKAVEAAIDYLQETAAFSRVGKEGKRLERADLIVALFEHSTSRALDPQLHTHALFMNIGVGEDGRTRTLSSLSLFLSKMTAGALYRAELSYQLELLGIETERHRSWFEVSHVSEPLMDHFSKRRQEIEKALAEKGLDSAEASAVAAIETRDVKESVARAKLIEGWLGDGTEKKWTRREADSLFGVYRPERDTNLDLATAAVLATEQLTTSQAHFTKADFVRYMAEQAQSRKLSASDVRSGADAYLENSNDIVRLGVRFGEERFTTKAMMELEKSLLENAELLSRDHSHAVDAEVVMRVLAQSGHLSEEQMKAVWHLTTETGAIGVVSGMAGTGKTRMLGVARQVWEAGGFNVVGTALAAQATEELSTGADIESRNIAQLLIDIENGRSPLNSRTILVVDEAGMVATPEFERLTRRVREAGAKLTPIGDERQLQPIGPGAPFMELGVRFDQLEMSDIRRQNEPWARQAVKNLADGNARAALEAFVERGLVSVHETRDQAMRALVTEWKTDSKPLDKTLILAGTRREVSALNKLAQDARLEAGELSEHSAKVGEDSYFIGDRILFTKNHKIMGVLNGDRGVVKSILGDGSRMSVRLDSGEQVSFEVDAMTDFALGYASTTHKAQGSTSMNTYVLAGGPMQDRELSYVQASRAEDKTVFFVTRLDVGDEMARLAREMERSRQKEMAHSVLRDIGNDVGYD